MNKQERYQRSLPHIHFQPMLHLNSKKKKKENAALGWKWYVCYVNDQAIGKVNHRMAEEKRRPTAAILVFTTNLPVCKLSLPCLFQIMPWRPSTYFHGIIIWKRLWEEKFTVGHPRNVLNQRSLQHITHQERPLAHVSRLVHRLIPHNQPLTWRNRSSSRQVINRLMCGYES